jgi:hypothetical protein
MLCITLLARISASPQFEVTTQRARLVGRGVVSQPTHPSVLPERSPGPMTGRPLASLPTQSLYGVVDSRFTA